MLCSSFSKFQVEPSPDEQDDDAIVEKHAYGKSGLEKRNKEADGLFYLKTVYLPDQLEKNLKQYLKSKIFLFQHLRQPSHLVFYISVHSVTVGVESSKSQIPFPAREVPARALTNGGLNT